MGIAGRMVRERERLLGMSAEERAWRKQYLLDQRLAPNEPVYVAEYWRERTNPIRRFYQAPLNGMYNAIKPIIVSTSWAPVPCVWNYIRRAHITYARCICVCVCVL